MKITLNRTYGYTVKGVSGSGKAMRQYPGKTGEWVQLHDPQRNKLVTVRPSQLSAPSGAARKPAARRPAAR